MIRVHQSGIFRYLRYLGADYSTAEELSQDVFLAALKSSSIPVDVGNGSGSQQGAWLRGTARNLFLNHCRQNRRNPVKINSEAIKNAEKVWVEEFLRDGDGFDYLDALRKCLGSLSEDQKKVLDLRYVNGKSRTEMAQMNGMSENGIKSLLRRIRLSLAGCVQRRLGEAG